MGRTLSKHIHTSGSAIQATLAKGVMYVDKKMAEMNVLYGVYTDFRARNMIGSPTISELNTGTFDTVIDTLKKRSLVTISQLKVTHITADTHLVEVLEVNAKL